MNIYANYYETAFGNTASNTANGDNYAHTVLCDSTSGFYKDGTKIATSYNTLGSRSSTQPGLICAFTEEESFSPKWFFVGQIYYVRIIVDGEMFHNFIPMKRNSDGAIGLYDAVTGTFYTNAGTGTFIAGPEV